MSYRRGGLGLIDFLVVVALGMMAFTSAAPALAPGFLIAKKAPTELNATFGSVQEGVASIAIPNLNVEINCTGFTVQEGVTSSSTDGKIKLLHEGCTILVTSTKAEAAGCEVVTTDAGSTQKHVTTTALVVPAELMNGTFAILFEKIESTVLIKSEQGCVLPTTTKIKGETCDKIAAGNDTAELLIQSSATIQGECAERTALEGLTIGKGFKDKLLFGAQEATITANVNLFLTGVHKGLTLGVSLF